MKIDELKLYVWQDEIAAFTHSVIMAIAESEEQALENIIKEWGENPFKNKWIKAIPKIIELKDGVVKCYLYDDDED